MRFLPGEHIDVTQAQLQHGIDPSTVLFVKRRGRLHVELPGRADTFAFFREKRTDLDANGRWSDRVEYFVGAEKTKPVDWSEVLGRFKRWLSAHPMRP